MSAKSSLSQMIDSESSLKMDESLRHEGPKVRTELCEAEKYGNPWFKYRNHTKKKLPPLTAVRHKCLDCCCESAAEVKRCPATSCSLWPFRFGKFDEDHKGPKSVLKTINLKCRDCAPEVIKGKPEWQNCIKKCCPLWHLRFGKNPRRSGCGLKGGRPSNFK